MNGWEPDGRVIVKLCGALVPPAVATVTVRAPPVELSASTKFAVSDVVLVTLTVLTARSVPPTIVTVVAPTMKLVPVSVTATVVPRYLKVA